MEIASRGQTFAHAVHPVHSSLEICLIIKHSLSDEQNHTRNGRDIFFMPFRAVEAVRHRKSGILVYISRDGGLAPETNPVTRPGCRTEKNGKIVCLKIRNDDFALRPVCRSVENLPFRLGRRSGERRTGVSPIVSDSAVPVRMVRLKNRLCHRVGFPSFHPGSSRLRSPLRSAKPGGK